MDPRLENEGTVVHIDGHNVFGYLRVQVCSVRMNEAGEPCEVLVYAVDAQLRPVGWGAVIDWQDLPHDLRQQSELAARYEHAKMREAQNG